MKLLVAGGFDEGNPEQAESVRAFASALGEAIVDRGHLLLNGCRTAFDCLVAEAAARRLDERGEAPKTHIVSYVLAQLQPAHAHGNVIRSRLADWEIGSETFYPPEQVQQADAVLLVGGFDGTFRAANWSRIVGKPLLPMTDFGGAAAKVYDTELNEFERKYSGQVERLEYELLNSVERDWAVRAADVVALAEKLAVSRWALVIMSYAGTPELEDAYDSFEQVTGELGFRCERVTQANARDRILPDILRRIRRAAFTIVDLTDLRPNVFYELGYADALGKRVVVTARHGTELPFDVKDIPTIFWDGQRRLKEDLRARLREIAPGGDAVRSAP